jgi:hypothetical protein
LLADTLGPVRGQDGLVQIFSPQGQLPPAPKGPLFLYRAGKADARAHGLPVVGLVDPHGVLTVFIRFIAELSRGIITPTPEAPVALDGAAMRSPEGHSQAFLTIAVGKAIAANGAAAIEILAATGIEGHKKAARLTGVPIE